MKGKLPTNQYAIIVKPITFYSICIFELNKPILFSFLFYQTDPSLNINNIQYQWLNWFMKLFRLVCFYGLDIDALLQHF